MLESKFLASAQCGWSTRFSDFTETFSVDGRLIPGVKELLNNAARIVKLHAVAGTPSAWRGAHSKVRNAL